MDRKKRMKEVYLSHRKDYNRAPESVRKIAYRTMLFAQLDQLKAEKKRIVKMAARRLKEIERHIHSIENKLMSNRFPGDLPEGDK